VTLRIGLFSTAAINTSLLETRSDSEAFDFVAVGGGRPVPL
jgi:hypothetical protein